LSTDSQKLDSCNEGGLNLISKNNNNNSNNNRNRTTSSNYTINNNELPSDDIDPATIKSERIVRSSSRSHCETENEKLNDEQEKSDGDSQESASENEGDNNNNEDDEREEGEICEDGSTKNTDTIEKSKQYKKKKRRRRKREMTLKSDQSQQIEDDEDDEMAAIKESPLGDDNDGINSDSYNNDNLVRKHSASITRRRHSSSSDPVNLSIGHKHQQDDSDDANIDVETISNAPTKVSSGDFPRFLGWL
jgi:hypothetical protein